MVSPENVASYKRNIEKRFAEACGKNGWVASLNISEGLDSIVFLLKKSSNICMSEKKKAEQSIEEFLMVEFGESIKGWPPEFQSICEVIANSTGISHSLTTCVRIDVAGLVGMTALLEFLENDELWRPLPPPNTPHTGSSLDNIQRELTQCIQKSLTGEDIAHEQLRRVIRHLELMNQLSAKQNSHIYALTFLTGLSTFLGIRLQKYNCEMARWLEAKKHFDALMSSLGRQHVYEPSSSIRQKACAIKQLRSWGYTIPIRLGLFFPAPRDIVRFSEAMRYRFDKLGYISVEAFLKTIYHSYYDSTNSRYRFQESQPLWGDVKTQVPWGYLLNVALAYFGSDFHVATCVATKTLSDIETLSKCFFSVLEIQPGSRFEVLFRPGSESLDMLRDAILYHQHFAMDQLPIDVMGDILEGFNNLCNPSDAMKLYVAILKWASKKVSVCAHSCLGFCFTEKELLKDFANTYSQSAIMQALNHLSQDAQTLNHGYCNPMDNSPKNYYKKPFIKKGDIYFLLDANLFSKGFYHVWFDSFSENNPQATNQIGDIFEVLFLRALNNRGVQVVRGCKYTVTHEVRNDLEISSEEGECDFIVESANTIVFIEAKKKEITSKAMAGYKVDALTDMGQSLVRGLTQACKHEYCLRKKGVLSFHDGTSLQLMGRRVVKIHLSMFDRGILHDRIFIIKFLGAILGYDYSCPEQKQLTDFQKQQRLFRQICYSPLMQHKYKGNTIPMSCLSLSLPQMLHLLQDVMSTDSFIEAISRTIYQSYGSQDFYQEYSLAKHLTSKKNDKA